MLDGAMRNKPHTIKTRKAGEWKEVQYHTHIGNELHPGEEFKGQSIPDLSRKTGIS